VQPIGCHTSPVFHWLQCDRVPGGRGKIIKLRACINHLSGGRTVVYDHIPPFPSRLGMLLVVVGEGGR
jgi:hypothetical protein